MADSEELFSLHELTEVVSAATELAERLREIMALLDGVTAALASLATDASAAADRVTTDLAAVVTPRDAALADVTSLQAQVAALEPMVVTQADLDALTASIAVIATAVQGIDTPPPPGGRGGFRGVWYPTPSTPPKRETKCTSH